MALNVRKGSAHSLAQTDTTASVTVNALTRVVTPTAFAGQLVYKDTTGALAVVPKLNNATRASATNKIGDSASASQVGFAVNNTDEGDVKECAKMGIYLLDGGSVIETSYYTGTVTAADIGKPVIQDASTGTDGNVCVVAHGTTEKILGWVYDAPRSIYVGQTPVSVLPIKLNA